MVAKKAPDSARSNVVKLDTAKKRLQKEDTQAGDVPSFLPLHQHFDKLAAMESSEDDEDPKE